MDTLEWIENWYASQCDGDWEHDYGVKINTVDNPGWAVTIDLEGTELETLEIHSGLIEGPEVVIDRYGDPQTTDWYNYSFEKKRFRGVGDPTKLRFLLEQFRRLAQEHSTR